MKKFNIVENCVHIKEKILISTTVAALICGGAIGMYSSIDVFATELEEEFMEEEFLQEEQYRVKFVNYDGMELYNELLPVGTFIMEPEVPERIGFSFLGWAPEVDVTVTNQDVEYVAQFVETGGGVLDDNQGTDDNVVVYDNDSNNASSNNGGEGDFINFLFMIILFLMETVWLHDRRSQQLRRYDAVMSMMDKE